jgi:hypothetical protein
VNARVNTRPLLLVDPDPSQPALRGVAVRKLDSDLMAYLGRYTQGGCLPEAVLRVTVAEPGAPIDDSLPGIWGRYQILDDGLRFIPHFPFEPGLCYRASFDPRLLGRSEFSDAMTLEFSIPAREQSLPSTKVKHIFPSIGKLPENLLRFYVCFSNAMQRGRATAEISLLGPDGKPAHDVLYRAPIELWDRSMRCLTVLLDPGRLKRGVGPHRELGPPLKAGQICTLVVGTGMTDSSGRQLPEAVCKRFHVTAAVREPIAIERWEIVPPAIHTHEPLVLRFSRPLDWALLSHSITIASKSGQSLGGRIVVDQCENRWRFTPDSPWVADSYHVRIASGLEDVCGNSVTAAFDRPLRSDNDLAFETASCSIPFDLV